MEEEPSSVFILNMTSDTKIRKIVNNIKQLASQTTDPPEMSWFDQEFDPLDSNGPFLPFTSYVITGTAGAGKSTSISAMHQHLNCLITGATTVAAQNLTSKLRTFCPTIFNAFGFKSRHINILPRMIPKIDNPSIEILQQYELAKYWPIITDIKSEFMKKKQHGMYSSLNMASFQALSAMGTPALYTTNIIVIDEAGTLTSYILSTVVFFYWFYNSWLNTPLYRAGIVPCIVCVGSPTQTDAFLSTYIHSEQKHRISSCENILSFLIGNKIASDYINLNKNWALFINNKRCCDPQFGHLLKLLEYNLGISEDVLAYVDRFVVARAKILDPLEYIGWTRLFLSHNEVKSFLTSLHSALTLMPNNQDVKLFTCPIVCEVFHKPLEEYKAHVNLHKITAIEWLTKNLSRMSNYSQFIDQDMTIVNTEYGPTSTKVTYLVKYVKNTYVSLNGKTRKCICGYMGSYGDFKKILDTETFIDSHSHDKPEFVYGFLNTLLYNSMYSFHKAGLDQGNEAYLVALRSLEIPSNLLQIPNVMEDDLWTLSDDGDVFYHKVPPPPNASAASIAILLGHYQSLKNLFLSRLDLACLHFGNQFLQGPLCTFTVNMQARDGVDFSSPSGILPGLLAYASTVESYKIKGYTFLPVNFGRFSSSNLSKDLEKKMPRIIVEDSQGFVACLETNINKMTETTESGDMFHICSAGDYGLSSKLAMTIVKAQGMSLEKVAISFGNHKRVKLSNIYVAISRATNPDYIVMDKNPLKDISPEDKQQPISRHIIHALSNPNTLLVY
ncbi:DNA helicase-primase complex component [Saguinine gammaherpesvirus 1]|uniref:DNA helicase-primase complex component n=1 Tax=Saguinine gammaherpesvirus 1 TaxID=2169901 RepID=A0A9Q8VJB4_9GAMA|nr:DNA helicase-primase complex component [Saguinine gammaherpesvirus 1]